MTAIFLDRDGTIIADRNYLSDPDGVELLDGAKEGILNLKKFGCELFLFSNQSGIARGIITADDVLRCNARMDELLGGGVFREICVAPEGPDDAQFYRKPSPKFIVEMMEKYGFLRKNCHMVGDRECDIFAGINAGVNPVLISSGHTSSAEMATLSLSADVKIFPSILDFSNWLIGNPP
ncbi:MAG: HAD-IIIA family hydrolase [Puniceicoccales bacterium]|nr:HAD-IIIA family hydrolase [Puniceicoccales bacterium]